jgi:hypothetical protein
MNWASRKIGRFGTRGTRPSRSKAYNAFDGHESGESKAPLPSEDVLDREASSAAGTRFAIPQRGNRNVRVQGLAALGGAVFLSESHPRAEHRNFLLDLHADRPRRRTVGRCPKIVNGEVRRSWAAAHFGVRCVRANAQKGERLDLRACSVNLRCAPNSCVQRERNAEMTQQPHVAKPLDPAELVAVGLPASRAAPVPRLTARITTPGLDVVALVAGPHRGSSAHL